jgi:hypothetical protein
MKRVGVLQPREFGLAAPRPAQAQRHGRARLGLGRDVAVGVVGRAFVELHDDVAVEDGLDLHRDLGREEELVAVDRRGEPHAFLADLAHRAQRPDLEAARIGEDGLVPLLELMQAAEAGHHVQAGAHPEVEGVAQDDLRAHLLEAARHHALDGAVGAHGHEDRCLHNAVVEGERAAAGVAVGVGGEEFEVQHASSLDQVARASSIASP